VPITAKLSRQFYEKLGDEVTNELVAWLNAVDASYRQEFRELFEAHFGRLESQMARLAAELRAEFQAALHREIGALRAELEPRFASLDARLAGVEARLGSVDERLGNVDTRLAGLEAGLDHRFAATETRLGARMAAFEKRLIRWMFGLWIGTVLALATALMAVQRLG